MNRRKMQRYIIWGSTAFALLLFGLDIPFPRGITPAALYVAVVGASLWLPGNRPIYLAAIGSTILTTLGFFLSGPGPFWGDIYDRAFAILAIWSVALLCVLYKRTEQRTLELAAIVESSGEAILSNNLSGMVTSWNASAEQLFGYAAEEVVGKPANFFLAQDRRKEGLPLFDAALSGQRILHFETVCERKDGMRVPVSLSVSPVLNSAGEVIALATIARDLTEHKRATEAQLAREAAEASSRAKSEFLASMSHEIRTPMNGVLGMLDLTLGTELESEQRHYLERAKASADLLLRVINDILDFSKIEAGRLDLEPTDFSLRESLGETIKGFGPQAHRKGLELALHVAPQTPELLRGDMLRLVQILTNLVGNAIKFTDKGEVVVQAGVESQSGKEIVLHLAVTDTGPGIPADKQKMIFGAFAQADSSMARRFGGTGLGLAISSRLVELMGGRIWVESEVGKGSVFHFTARFEVQDQPAVAPRADRVDLEEMPVLAADDNETNLNILTEMLTNWRMRPTGVSGGRDAIAALKRAAAAGEPFPLVLLDSVMPDLDGFMVAEQIKRDPDLADATIMMLSSLDGAGEVKRCHELGISIYLRKPFKQSELLNAILTSLGSLAEENTRAPASTGETLPRTLRILVAEDNEFNQDVVNSLLTKWGHTVAIAGNGKAALVALEKQPFDLVLMDVQMPEMDGLATTAAIRAKESGSSKRVPIIALTAHAMKGDRERCIAAGMDAYVAKPIKSVELLAVMKELLGAEAKKATTAEAPASPKSQAVFDPEAAVAGIDGDRDIFRQMIQWFGDQSARSLDDIRSAIARHDGADLAAAAHKLKAQVGSFAAKDAYDAAVRLEELAKAGDAMRWNDALSAVEASVEQLRDALAQYSKSQNT